MRLWFGRACVVGVLLMVSSGCATHGVVHVAPDESRPHFTWEIRAGVDEGDEELVCGSANPAQACTLSASTVERRVLATVHLAVHAAAQPTSYLGFMRVPFFEGNDTRNFGEVNTTVAPGSRPVLSTVIGRVTSKPGTYTLVISVAATQPGTATPQHLSQEASVIVRPAESRR